jgi:hypothetical protein
MEKHVLAHRFGDIRNISISDWLIGLVIENGYFEQETLTNKQDRETFYNTEIFILTGIVF